MKGLGIVCLAAALSASVMGQEVKVPQKAGRDGQTSGYVRSRQIVFTGRVVGKTKAAPAKGEVEAVSLLVKTPKGGTSQVDLGPSWYVAGQVARIKVGDQVKVIGSKVPAGKGYVVLARQIVNPKNEVLTMRDLRGVPYWTYARTDLVAPKDLPAGAVTGTVLRDYTTEIDGVPYGGYVVKTADGNMNIVTAPQWYLQRQEFSFSPGNHITVIGQGSPTLVAPYTILADTIYGPGTAIVLSSNGIPVYRGWGPPLYP